MEECPQDNSAPDRPKAPLSDAEWRPDAASESTAVSRPSQSSDPPPKPPTLRNANDGSCSNTMTSSSAPLGQINAARRPGPPSTRASGLTSDIAAKMKAFSLSRQGAPTQNMRPPPGPAHTVSTNNAIPLGAFAPGAVPHNGGQQNEGQQNEGQQNGGLASPHGALAGRTGGLQLPPAMARPQLPNWNSSPQVGGQSPRMMSPRPGMGGLAAKRGIKGGGMKLSDATGPPPPVSAGGDSAGQQSSNETKSAFSKYSKIIDTQKGTLNFENKAVIHGGGIEFTSGTSFSISLDEVDTIEELGKGNYGTVYKVRHTRPKMRRPGQGLRGTMTSRPSAASISSTVSEDSTASAPAATGTGIVMAMKEIRLELDDAKFAAIIMELDILHRCISPFIVSFYGAFFQEGSVYICLEHMDGGSVDKLYGDGVPEGVLRKITLSTVMGLMCLKDEHNIIHRDVKPTNILVNTRGQVKICDFGVSGNLVASIAKTNIGCQSYMAPERISGGGMAQAGANPGGGTYSVQSDIWSLGLSIIECAMGRYPYPPETYNNIFSQLSAIVDGDPPDLPAAGYSEAARDFVRGCLHKIPKMRPTYAMLLRHAWLAPLMKPPTISEDEEAEAAAEAGAEAPPHEETDWHPETADKEVADWVRSAIERKLSGKMGKSEKPALHAAPLDAVPGSPLLDRQGLHLNTASIAASDLDHHNVDVNVDVDVDVDVDEEEAAAAAAVEESAATVDPEPRDGVTIDSPVLQMEMIHPMDFADGARPNSSSGPSESDIKRETEAQAREDNDRRC